MNRKPGTGKNAVNLALLKWSKRKFPRGLNRCAFFYVPSVFTWKMVVSPPEPPPRGLRHHHPLTWTTNQPGTSANFHSCSPRRHFCSRRPVLTMQINPIRTLLHTLCCLSGKAQPDLSATSLSPLISLPAPWPDSALALLPLRVNLYGPPTFAHIKWNLEFHFLS